MKVFKLVCKGYKNFIPFTSIIEDEYYILRYDFNKITVPKVGKLYGFKSFEDAINYKKFTGFGELILEGEAKNVSSPKFMARCEFVEEFLKAKAQHKSLKGFCCEVPKGTVTFDSFTPTNMKFF